MSPISQSLIMTNDFMNQLYPNNNSSINNNNNTNNTNLSSIVEQLKKIKPVNSGSMQSTHIGNTTLLKLPKNVADSFIKNNDGYISLGEDENGNAILTHKDSWLKQNSQVINTGMQLGSLGLGVMSYLDQRGLMKKQEAMLDEQLTDAKANREHLQSEWARVNKIRQNLSATY